MSKIEGGQSLGALVGLGLAIGLPFLILMIGLRAMFGLFGL
jgi:hypothetical protein